jgi:hypothetical protein
MVETARYLLPSINYKFLYDGTILKTAILDKLYTIKFTKSGDSFKSEVLNKIDYTDEILFFQEIQSDHLLIAGKSNKKIELFKDLQKVKE